MYRVWLEMDPNTREWVQRVFMAWRILKNSSVVAIAFCSIILAKQQAALPAANDLANDEGIF